MKHSLQTFTFRDLIFGTTILVLASGWWLDRERIKAELAWQSRLARIETPPAPNPPQP